MSIVRRSGSRPLLLSVIRAIAAILGATAFIVMVKSTFAPVMQGAAFDILDYVYFAPPLRTVLLALLASAAAVLAACWLERRFVRQPAAEGETADRATRHWTTPIALGIVSVVPLIVLMTGHGAATAIAAWIFIDLRWWWGTALLAVATWRFDRATGGRGWRALRAAASPLERGWRLEVLVAVMLMAWATATTPILRFTEFPHGDEVKYLRYCETWVQGNGLTISKNRPLAEVPISASNLAANLGLAVRAVAQEARAIVSDVAGFARSPGAFQWMRATGGNWFLAGKRGEVYQVHQPALSVLLVPGYLFDRWRTGTEAGYQGQLPATLAGTNTVMLLLFGAWAAVLTRFFRRATGSPAVAALAAIAAFATIPVAPFAFQMYPETAAGLCLVLVLLFFLRAQGAEPSRAAAFGYGLLAALLPWLHIRFLVLAAVVVAGGLLWLHRRARPAFLIGSAVPIVLLSAYSYRLTGSLLPWAHWSAPGTDHLFAAGDVPAHMLGFALDRTWGVAPHAPVYLTAAAALVMFARAYPRAVLFGLAMLLALAVPSAGHGINAGGGSPARHLVAVAPLFLLPAALLFLRPRARWVTALTAVLVAVSLQQATAYNRWHVKHQGEMHDWSVSGWKPNLVFPDFAGRSTSPAGGPMFEPAYAKSPRDARDDVVRAYAAEGRCRLCLSLTRGWLDEAGLTWNAVESLAIEIRPTADPYAPELVVRAWAAPRDPAYGMVRMDFGDGT
ncbi:MAG TPA: hypothetical protein VMN81_04435, partial [Vicinamibacterales bacterium]|nr:hypothetical protein [Vicinamibacterales bacterium]